MRFVRRISINREQVKIRFADGRTEIYLFMPQERPAKPQDALRERISPKAGLLARCRRCGAEKPKSELHYGRCREPCRVLEAIESQAYKITPKKRGRPPTKLQKNPVGRPPKPTGKCVRCGGDRPKEELKWRRCIGGCDPKGGVGKSAPRTSTDTSIDECIRRPDQAERTHQDTNPAAVSQKHCYLCRSWANSNPTMGCSCGCHVGGSG